MPLGAHADIKLDFKGFIADEADILTKDIKNDLNMTLWDLQKKSGADIAVVIVNSLGGRTVEDVALDIGRTYKVGSKEKNNGIVFLTALNERKMRIELGLGFKDKISIPSLDNIRDYDILPYYKRDDYVNGIARGTYKLAELAAKVENVEIKTQGICPAKATSASPEHKEHAPWWVYILAVIMSLFTPRRRRFNYGSFGGFGGGGGFGGSGCSGSW